MAQRKPYMRAGCGTTFGTVNDLCLTLQRLCDAVGFGRLALQLRAVTAVEKRLPRK